MTDSKVKLPLFVLRKSPGMNFLNSTSLFAISNKWASNFGTELEKEIKIIDKAVYNAKNQEERYSAYRTFTSDLARKIITVLATNSQDKTVRTWKYPGIRKLTIKASNFWHALHAFDYYSVISDYQLSMCLESSYLDVLIHDIIEKVYILDKEILFVNLFIEKIKSASDITE